MNRTNLLPEASVEAFVTADFRDGLVMDVVTGVTSILDVIEEPSVVARRFGFAGGSLISVVCCIAFCCSFEGFPDSSWLESDSGAIQVDLSDSST